MSELSAALPSLAAMSFPEVHAWRRFRDELAHFELRWHQGGTKGLTLFGESVISLREGMTYEQRRCTIAHESLHAERGQVPRGMKPKEEEKVRRATARIMLPDVRAIGEALAWAHTEAEAAEELGVDLPVLLNRLRHLHPAERGYLKRRLEDGPHVEDGA